MQVTNLLYPNPMARWIIALLLASAALGQTQLPKFDPNDPAAWQNAIRTPLSVSQSQDFSKPNGSSHFVLPLLRSGLLAPPSLNVSPAVSLPPSHETANLCAIPLTRVPIDPKIDPGIVTDFGAQFLDNMPQAKSMPVCNK
jgi:hypothetical protein